MFPRLKGCGAVPARQAAQHCCRWGAWGGTVPPRGIAWGHQASLGATGCHSGPPGITHCHGHRAVLPRRAWESLTFLFLPVGALHRAGATASLAELCRAGSGTGERGNLLKQANFAVIPLFQASADLEGKEANKLKVKISGEPPARSGFAPGAPLPARLPTHTLSPPRPGLPPLAETTLRSGLTAHASTAP